MLKSNFYFIYVDSAIEPCNPGGLLTWAFIAKLNNKVIHQNAQIIGWGKGMTNNRGESAAVLAALSWLITLPKEKRYPAIINSDSELTVKQCSGTCACNDETLAKQLSLIQRGRAVYGKAVTFRWIPRGKNTEADALSRSLYTGKERALELLKAHKLDLLFEGDDLPW